MSVQAALTAAVGGHRGTAAADRLCRACVTQLSVDDATVSLISNGANAGTLGASDERARAHDDLQFTLGEGPGPDSVAVRAPVLVVDLAVTVRSGRWPAYGPALLARGVVAVFAVPVVVAGEYLGALALFRARPGALRGADLAGALLAAQLAELPLLDLLSDDLHGAATDPDGAGWAELGAITRAEVSQATGMLVGQLDVEPAEALVRLRAHAFATGVSVSDVAREILGRRLRLDRDR